MTKKTVCFALTIVIKQSVLMNQFLILGGESRLAQCFKSLYPNECITLNKKRCDITKTLLLEQIIKKTVCPYIFNCAAITDTKECEKNPSYCFTVNAIAVYHLSKICLKYNKKLIHVSSNAAVRPLSMYGWSKHLSEKIVKPHTLIIRTDFYDKNTYIVKNLLQKKPIKAYTNVYFNPVSVNCLAYQIDIHRDRSGTINIFTNEKVSFYEFAQEFCDVFSLDKRLVKGVKSRPLNLFVKSTINRSIAEDLVGFKQYIAQK